MTKGSVSKSLNTVKKKTKKKQAQALSSDLTSFKYRDIDATCSFFFNLDISVGDKHWVLRQRLDRLPQLSIQGRKIAWKTKIGASRCGQADGSSVNTAIDSLKWFWNTVWHHLMVAAEQDPIHCHVKQLNSPFGQNGSLTLQSNQRSVTLLCSNY